MKKFKISIGYKSEYKFAILCGLCGSLAALFAKEGIQPHNKFYEFILSFTYGWIFSIILRCFFFGLMIYSNARMIEYKIRSFAALGSSMTVVAAFQANYAFNMLYEIIIYLKFPSLNQYIGSIFCLAGVFVLRHQIVSNKEDQSKVETESIEPDKSEKTESKCDVIENVTNITTEDYKSPKESNTLSNNRSFEMKEKPSTPNNRSFDRKDKPKKLSLKGMNFDNLDTPEKPKHKQSVEKMATRSEEKSCVDKT